VEEPVFAGFEAADDRVAGGLCIRCGVLGRRVVAAADVTALGAPAQLQPLAFNPTGPAGWNRNVDSRYGVHVASPRIRVPVDHVTAASGPDPPQGPRGPSVLSPRPPRKWSEGTATACCRGPARSGRSHREGGTACRFGCTRLHRLRRPKPAAAQLVGVALHHHPVGAVRDPSGVGGRHASGEARVRQVHGPPEEVDGTGLASEVGPEFVQDPAVPSLERMCNWWSQKSNSMSKAPRPYGINDEQAPSPAHDLYQYRTRPFHRRGRGTN
jgi:hypothetical protein